MMDGWKTVPLGKLCTISSGDSDTQDAVLDGPYAFFDRSKTIKRSTRYLHDCEALIIPGEGKEFLPKHFSGKFDLHQRAYALYGFAPDLDIRFLYHFLHHRSDYFPSVAVGATVKSLRRRHFADLPVPVPSLAEQRRIVDVLDEALEGIAVAKAHAEENFLNARALFESRLQSFFTHRDGQWEVRPLGDFASFKNGLNFDKNSIGQTLPFVGVADFQDNDFAPIEQLGSATIDGVLADGYLLKRDDILIVRSNGSKHLVGRSMLIGDLREATSYSGFVIRVRFDASQVFPLFLLRFLKCQTTRQTLTSGGGGANITNINQGKLTSLRIPLPPYGEQITISGAIEEMKEETRNLEKSYRLKLTSLDELRKSLLNHAFSGKL